MYLSGIRYAPLSCTWPSTYRNSDILTNNTEIQRYDKIYFILAMVGLFVGPIVLSPS